MENNRSDRDESIQAKIKLEDIAYRLKGLAALMSSQEEPMSAISVIILDQAEQIEKILS